MTPVETLPYLPGIDTWQVYGYYPEMRMVWQFFGHSRDWADVVQLLRTSYAVYPENVFMVINTVKGITLPAALVYP